MESKIKIVNGEVVLKKIKFNRCIEKIVGANNETSSKISLPKDLEGKKVLICWEEVKK